MAAGLKMEICYENGKEIVGMLAFCGCTFCF